MHDEIPFETLYDLTFVTDVVISPTGMRLAFLAKEFDPGSGECYRSLFVAPTDGSADPHRLSRVASASQPRWSPDGTKLGFLAARPEDQSRSLGRDGLERRTTRTHRGADPVEAGGHDVVEDEGPAPDPTRASDSNPTSDRKPMVAATSDEEEVDIAPKRQVWLFDLVRGGDARQVTTREWGVRAFDWGPAGERIVVSSPATTEAERRYLEQRRDGGPVVTERLQHKFDGEGWLDPVMTYLFVVDVESRVEQRLDDAYGGGAFEHRTGLQPRWGPSRIAFLSNRTERPDATGVMNIYTIRPDGSDLTRLTDGGLWAAGPTWSPDGNRLAFVGRYPENHCIPAQIFVGNVGTGECRSLTDDVDRTVTHESTVRWLDEATLVAPVADEAKTRLLRVAADAGSHEWVFDHFGYDRAITGFDCNGGTATFVLSRPDNPPDVYTMPAAVIEQEPASPDDLTRISTTNDAFRDECPLPDYRRITFESDGHELDGLVYVPRAFDRGSTARYPVIVSIHGGPYNYDLPEFSFEYAAWTSRGYVVFCPNYRGGLSYGREFAETLRGEWGTVEVADVVAGVEDLVDREWVDPDRVFGSGFSYGATAQAHIVAQTDLFTAAAPDHGLYNLRADFGVSDWHVGYTNVFGLPWENPDAYEKASSITDVDEMETPLLLLAGGEDWRCPSSQSEQLYVSLKKRGVPAKLVLYPGENHHVENPECVIHRMEQIEDWFERHDPEIP